ncbi:MAG: GIY-YIG nuclease family protein [Gammaproteobacteria bacterium]
MTDWYVYMVRCSDNTLYTGITRDIARRIEEHNADNRRGAAYTRSRRPVSLVYGETCRSRSEATLRELVIKQMSREEKETLLGEVGDTDNLIT